eukprot:898650-Amphidinium_carterae.1
MLRFQFAEHAVSCWLAAPDARHCVARSGHNCACKFNAKTVDANAQRCLRTHAQCSGPRACIFNRKVGNGIVFTARLELVL